MGIIFGLKEADKILDKALLVRFSFWFKRDYFSFLRFSQYIESHDVKYLELLQSDCIINIRIFVFGPI